MQQKNKPVLRDNFIDPEASSNQSAAVEQPSQNNSAKQKRKDGRMKQSMNDEAVRAIYQDQRA